MLVPGRAREQSAGSAFDQCGPGHTRRHEASAPPPTSAGEKLGLRSEMSMASVADGPSAPRKTPGPPVETPCSRMTVALAGGSRRIRPKSMFQSMAKRLPHGQGASFRVYRFLTVAARIGSDRSRARKPALNTLRLDTRRRYEAPLRRCGGPSAGR
jgi:hypothetical protein